MRRFPPLPDSWPAPAKLFAPRRILAATDNSPVSTCALRHAVMWARHFGAHLTVLQAYELPLTVSDGYLFLDVAEVNRALRQETERQLTQQVQQFVPPDVPVSHEVAAGYPTSVIERTASAIVADLVVLGTHGRRGLGRLLLGSVAEDALRLAQRPTLLVHPTSGAELASAGEPHIRHILCLVNESTVARLAFEHARLVARTFGAWLTALYVSEPAGDLASAETLRRVEDRIRSWLTPGPAASSYGVQAIVRHGDAAAQVGSLAAEAAVDLVVIGAQHHRFVDATALGISTLRLTRHVPSPVLIVPGSSEAVLGVPQSASDAVEWRRGAA